MNRRSFFGLFAAAPAVAQGPLKNVSFPEEYRGPSVDRRIGIYRSKEAGLDWKVYWTGWKSSSGRADLVGQWIATPVYHDGKYDKSRLSLYSSCPGDCGPFRLGAEFNIAVLDGQSTIEPDRVTSQEMAQAQQGAYVKLVEKINGGTWFDARMRPYEKPSYTFGWKGNARIG